MNKITKTLYALTILLSSDIVSASIINNGDYTTVNGLDWLDWTLTKSMTQTQALSSNIDYRTATLAEMENLMNTMYGTTLVFGNDGINPFVNITDIATKNSRFGDMFGYTDGGSYTFATVEGLGLVGFGASIYAGAGNYWSGLNSIWDIAGYAEEWNGVALVKAAATSHPVPEPTTIAIFALGMIGLASRRVQRL